MYYLKLMIGKIWLWLYIREIFKNNSDFGKQSHFFLPHCIYIIQYPIYLTIGKSDIGRVKPPERLKEVMKNLKPAIKYTLQMITSVLVALEISTPPNPYKVHIIVCLTLLIALKYDWPSKIEKSLNKIVVTLLNLFWKSPRL